MTKRKNTRLKRAILFYTHGTFSAEQAAHFAQISLWSFFALLQDKKVPLSYDKEELEKDIRTLRGKREGKESISTMFASENVLKKDWKNEADERWNDI